MCHYTHFTTEEREKSRVLKAQGLSIRAIAKELGKTPSSVSREFRRNCYANGDYATYHADSGILPQQLKKIMRFKWKHKKCKGTDNRGKIPDTTPICEHPAGAENRSRYGHWESDTVLGMRKTGSRM